MRSDPALQDDHIHVQSVRATAYATRVSMQDLRAIGANTAGWYMMAYYHGHRLLARGEVRLTG